MWEAICFFAGMVVLMLFIAILPFVFDIPEAVANYFSKKSRQWDAHLLPRDPDEQAARLLGENLRRAGLATEGAAQQIMAAFWAADASNRRALAHLVAGLTEAGPVEEDADLLALLPSSPTASTGIQVLPEGAK